MVWRTRDRLRFVSHVGLDHESLFATAGEPDGKGRGAARMYHLDPYAGVARWARDLPEGPSFLGAPLVSDHEVVLVTRDRRGLGLLALDRATGETAWSSEPGLFPVASAWLSIDDAIVISSESGDLVSLSTRTGEANWRHRFPRGMEGINPANSSRFCARAPLRAPAAGARRPPFRWRVARSGAHRADPRSLTCR